MLDQVMEVFGLTPDTDLDLMRPDQSLASLSARALVLLDGYLEAERPDLVLVQGDTTTAFCAGLAAFYRRIPFGHVEAGLRTWDLSAPWPEEANRVLISRLARFHFAPTITARDNLLREGVTSANVAVTGNTVIDALLVARARVRSHPVSIPQLPEFLQPAESCSRERVPIVLVTGHRRENFGAAFENICRGIAELAARFPETHFVYPVHLNPNVRGPVLRILGRKDRLSGPVAGAVGRMDSVASNIHLIEPLSYLPFVALMDRASLILTDSGGVQEEAPSLGKPVLVMRETTERPEAVAAGTVRLVGTDSGRIVDEVSTLLTDQEAYDAMARAHNPYGDGRAADRISRICQDLLAPGEARTQDPSRRVDEAQLAVAP